MLTALTWLATTRIGRMAVAAGVFVLGALALIDKGRRDAQRAEERRKLKDYQETRKRADDALRRAEADTRPADERLEQHGHLRGAGKRSAAVPRRATKSPD